MILNNEKWLAAVKKAVVDTKMQPSSGLVCAIASLRIVRDGLLDDVGFDVNNPESDSPEAMAIRDGVNELIKHLTGQLIQGKVPMLNGFCSNASAAAKAAGVGGSAVQLAGLLE